MKNVNYIIFEFHVKFENPLKMNMSTFIQKESNY